MHWIESISRAPTGRLELVGRNLDGDVKRFSPSQFPYQLPGTHTKLRVSLSSDSHCVTPVGDYLKLMGWLHFGCNGQRLHRFYADGLEVWAPSQVVFKMIFATISALYDTAFCGRSVYEIATPSCTDDPMKLMPGWRRKCVSRLYPGDAAERDNTLIRRLFWLLHSVSASKALRYVYRNASQGVLDVPMPQGTFDVHVAGKRIGGLMLATRLRISKVVCDDLRLLDGTPLASMELNFHERDLTYLRKRGMSSDALTLAGTWDFTESQFSELLDWMFNAGVIGDREHYTEAHARVLKRHLELLRARFVGRYEWKALPCTRQELACVQARYYKLRKAGHWEQVNQKLLAS